jgi:putative membrane-bound dehydrogenase-like protein
MLMLEMATRADTAKLGLARSQIRDEPSFLAVLKSAFALILPVLIAVGWRVALAADAPSGPAPPPPTLEGPLSPEDAPRSFRLDPGLRLEQVAAEPMVASPVAVAFDEKGRMYVAEDRGYPLGPGEGKPPDGRVALLEDTDGDGRMDRRSEFAVGLSMPKGVMPWKGGAIVTSAPDVLYLRDTDGDGRADEKRVLFTGFETIEGSSQLRVSHPSLSIDNWIYVSTGRSGGKVICPAHPKRAPVEMSRADFRFRPDGSVWESTDGNAQFGLTFDDFGRRFVNYNRVPVQHLVLGSQVLRRNPRLAFSETVQHCPAELQHGLKGDAFAVRLYPISRNITNADAHAGTFTAACGVMIYRGTGLPDLYQGGAFSCDPTGNLVHFDLVERKGATFVTRSPHPGVEFLASSDTWCRPVFVAPGPDGALYICDMYRKTIEHPRYLPEEVRKRTDFNSGKTMGRIWRVICDDRSEEEARALRRVDLAGLSTEELCGTLRNRDGWWRDTAHRLLLERGDRGAVQPLRSLVMDERAEPATTLHAVHLLNTLGALDDDLLDRLLRQAPAPVREHAIQLVAPRLASSPRWRERVLECADHEDARVRFQAATVLEAARDGEAAVGALARMAVRDPGDRWLSAAVFSALAGREASFLVVLRDASGRSGPLPPEFLTELGRLLGASQPPSEWPRLIGDVVNGSKGFSAEEQAELITGIATSARSKAASKDDVFSTLIGRESDSRALKASLQALLSTMAQVAVDSKASLARRIASVSFLSFASYDQIGEVLPPLLEAVQPSALQVAAVRALGSHRDDRVVKLLLDRERFARFLPATRAEVMSALGSQLSHLPGLLAALENGSIPLTAVDAARRRALTQNRDPAVRKRAEALFGEIAGDRAKVYESYKDVVELPSDPVRGRAVFRRECSSCHRLDREGFMVGPDIRSVRRQPKQAVLLHILAPDYEITPGYTAYTVSLRDGRVLSGLISSETSTSITLRQPNGKEDSILREEIDELSASKQSLMPQGLEKNISRQEFADLLSHLRGEGPPDSEGMP